MNEVLNIIPAISVKEAQVTLNNYDDFIAMCQEVKNIVDSTVITEDNLPEVKDILARARKVEKGLTDKRIQIKKEILKQYEVFESQIKEGIAIIDSADSELRSKVRELEEAERDAKEVELHKLFNEYLERSDVSSLVTFEFILDQKWLNKSVSLKKATQEMYESMNTANEDLYSFNGNPDSSRLIDLYLQGNSVAQAINKLNQEKETAKRIAELTNSKPVESFTITIHSKKDFELAKRLLEENDIKFN